MIIKEPPINTGYDVSNQFWEITAVKNILSVAIMLSLTGCALKAPEVLQPPVKQKTPAPEPEKKTTLYSLFFGQDEETDASSVVPSTAEVKQPEVVTQQPVIKPTIRKPAQIEVKQPILPAPIVKEAPIHKAINKAEIPPEPQPLETAKRQTEEDSSIFSFFSSKSTPAKVNLQQECIGDINLPISLQRKFDEVKDDSLLTQAIGGPGKGKLCQGKVYQVKKNAQVNLFRTWNGNNVASQHGNWWTFAAPRGSIANYRQQNSICYQWTPLDKLSHCRLKAGSKIVVGTGQSVHCSDNLTYPASQTQQVFIIDAPNAVADCRDYDASFSWTGQVNKR